MRNALTLICCLGLLCSAASAADLSVSATRASPTFRPCRSPRRGRAVCRRRCRARGQTRHGSGAYGRAGQKAATKAGSARTVAVGTGAGPPCRQAGPVQLPAHRCLAGSFPHRRPVSYTHLSSSIRLYSLTRGFQQWLPGANNKPSSCLRRRQNAEKHIPPRFRQTIQSYAGRLYVRFFLFLQHYL